VRKFADVRAGDCGTDKRCAEKSGEGAENDLTVFPRARTRRGIGFFEELLLILPEMTVKNYPNGFITVTTSAQFYPAFYRSVFHRRMIVQS